MMLQVGAFLSGVVFAVGLGVGGMTQPAKVFRFLDVTGDWDPSLAFVMLGAIGVHAVTARSILRRDRPLFAPRFVLPTRTDLDARLVAGAALFGVGWALGGFCPGPAVTALGAGMKAAAVFVPAMLVGMMLARAAFERPAPAERAAPPARATS